MFAVLLHIIYQMGLSGYFVSRWIAVLLASHAPWLQFPLSRMPSSYLFT